MWAKKMESLLAHGKCKGGPSHGGPLKGLLQKCWGSREGGRGEEQLGATSCIRAILQGPRGRNNVVRTWPNYVQLCLNRAAA